MLKPFFVIFDFNCC